VILVKMTADLYLHIVVMILTKEKDMKNTEDLKSQEGVEEDMTNIALIVVNLALDLQYHTKDPMKILLRSKKSMT